MESFLKDKVGKVITSYGAKVMDIIKTGTKGKSLFKFWGDVRLFKLFIRETDTTPSAPNSGFGGIVYVKDDGKPYFISSTTPEVDLSQASGASAIDDLTDVDTTTSAPVAGEVLKWDGVNWVPDEDNNTIYTHPLHPGDDIDEDTTDLTGASVVSRVDINVTTDAEGHVTDANGMVKTRNLTLGDLGYTGETDATADQSAAEILTSLLSVDGTGSLLDADLLDGMNSSEFTVPADISITDNILAVGNGSGIEDSVISSENVAGTSHLSSINPSGGFHVHSLDVDVAGTVTGDLIFRSGMTPGTNSQEDGTTPNDTTSRTTGILYLISGHCLNFGSGNTTSGAVRIDAGASSSLGGITTQGKVIIGSSTFVTEIGMVSGGETKIKSDLTEVGKSTHTTGEFLKWDGSKAVWDAVPPSGATDLDGLTDVTITSVADNDILKYDLATTQWVNEVGTPGGATDLDGLTDVTITSVADNQVLKYDLATTQWVNEAETGGVAGADMEVQYNNAGVLAGTRLIKITAANEVTLGGATGTNANILMNAGSDLILEADNGGGSGSSSIQYKDAGGGNKLMLAIHSSNKVTLCNRASNGTVEIRANSSTAGSGGEHTVVTFHHDGTELRSNSVTPTNPNNKLYNLDGELHFDRDAIPRVKTITLTPSQYQNLGSTAIDLIPAQGTDKHVVISNVFIKAVNGSTTETSVRTLRVGHVAHSTTHYHGLHKDFLRAMPTSATWVRQIENNNGKLSDVSTANRSVVIYADGNFTGDITLSVVVNYSVIKI